MSNLTPKQIVAELDRFVVGQHEAKKAVASALRNRWRRKFVDKSIQDEIVPHNILMIGPTGVGKTEIAHRLAKLTNSPFIKVEATKFTEVGYVGRDVESIIRDLLDSAINQIREAIRKEVKEEAIIKAEKRLIETIVGNSASDETKAKFYQKFKEDKLNENEIELEIQEASTNNPMQTLDIPGAQLGVLNLGDIVSKAFGQKKTKLVRITVQEAYNYLIREESDKLIDEEKVIRKAISAVEEDGIVFLDEIDKIASNNSSHKKGISDEGVQCDLLPIIEGTTVNTKHGPIQTKHILFIASGAFHTAKPSDLLPELQGRLPVRVELQPLTEEDLLKILRDPINSLPKQYQALLAVEKVELNFTESGLTKVANLAAEINSKVEDIGARRLHTILEKLLENISFDASDCPDSSVVIDDKYVEDNLDKFINTKIDVSKFIL